MGSKTVEGSDIRQKSNSPGFSGEKAAKGSEMGERDWRQMRGGGGEETEGKSKPLDNFEYERKVSQMSHKCHTRLSDSS